MKLIHANFGVLLAAMLLGSVSAWAQGSIGGNDERTYGTAALVSHTIQAFAFTGFSAADNAVFLANGFGSRFCSAPCHFEAAVFLPAGAVVTGFELEACDTSNSAQVKATLVRVAKHESGGGALAIVETGTFETYSGCLTAGVGMTPHTIDNVGNTYFVEVSIDGSSSTTRFQAVRIFYNLQVSPAPATARFNDVPTDHQFFPFVEALAAAGITGGCSVSPPLYCPDNFVTRGQMAAFISRALGLHFAP